METYIEKNETKLFQKVTMLGNWITEFSNKVTKKGKKVTWSPQMATRLGYSGYQLAIFRTCEALDVFRAAVGMRRRVSREGAECLQAHNYQNVNSSGIKKGDCMPAVSGKSSANTHAAFLALPWP